MTLMDKLSTKVSGCPVASPTLTWTPCETSTGVLAEGDLLLAEDRGPATARTGPGPRSDTLHALSWNTLPGRCSVCQAEPASNSRHPFR